MDSFQSRALDPKHCEGGRWNWKKNPLETPLQALFNSLPGSVLIKKLLLFSGARFLGAMNLFEFFSAIFLVCRLPAPSYLKSSRSTPEAFEGFVKVTKELLAAGACANVTDKKGTTLLMQDRAAFSNVGGGNFRAPYMSSVVPKNVLPFLFLPFARRLLPIHESGW